MLVLQGVTPTTLKDAVAGLTIEEARKIIGAVYRNDDLPATVRGVRRISIEAVRACATARKMEVRGVLRSQFDPFVKYSLEAPDGTVVETVRIPLEKPGRFTACVSSQAGCALGCLFCATGRLGLKRNLRTWEIVEQVRIVRRTLNLRQGERVHGIVFQGMGEPLANVDSVIEAIRILREPSGLAIDGRAITVCTAGIPAGIIRLAHSVPQVRLAISISSADRSIRRRLMPIEQSFPLAEVLNAASEHAKVTGLNPMWAITLLDGINDSEEDARLLAQLARDFNSKTGRRPRISIIAYSPIDAAGERDLSRSSPERESAYRRVLSEAGFPSHRRYSGGSDIRAACGQLAGENFP